MLDLCPICKAPKDSHDTVCSSCRAELDEECFDSFMSRCPECCFPKSSAEYECRKCSEGFTVYPVARFDGKLSYSVLYSYKFLKHKEFAPVIAECMSLAVEALDPEGKAVIVPVPCSEKRLRTNGWDHMVEVARLLNRPYLELLSNRSGGTQQKRLKKEARAENTMDKFCIASAFEGKISALKGLKVIVIDDVYTTGNTIHRVIELLRSYGFSDVSGAVWLCDYLPFGGFEGHSIV